MNSRERMLSAIKANQPGSSSLPDVDVFNNERPVLVEKYISVLDSIGGKAYVVKGYDEIREIIHKNFPDAKRLVSTCKELPDLEVVDPREDPHRLEDIDLAVIKGHLGVAENAAVWVTEDILPQRVLPFIAQYLAVVLHREDIVATMHHAYEKIGGLEYGWGAFIAGPSKTADIEQSLVLGAHGPKGMTIFIIDATS